MISQHLHQANRIVLYTGEAPQEFHRFVLQPTNGERFEQPSAVLLFCDSHDYTPNTYVPTYMYLPLDQRLIGLMPAGRPEKVELRSSKETNRSHFMDIRRLYRLIQVAACELYFF